MRNKNVSLKVLLVSALCVVVVGASISSSDAVAPQCPRISLSCSEDKKDNEPVNFQAQLQNVPRGQTPSFQWTVSAGLIVGRRDEGLTSNITVDATGVGGGDVTATVQVGNLGSNCKPSGDCTTHIIGAIAANAAPVVSIQASASTIAICPPDPLHQRDRRGDSPIIKLNANAFDPDNDTLTYSWSASGGRIAGTGRSVKWDLSELSPGKYRAKVQVSDGRTKVTTNITVTVTPCKPRLKK